MKNIIGFLKSVVSSVDRNISSHEEIAEVILNTPNLTQEIIENEFYNINWWNPTEKNKEWINDLEKNNSQLFEKLKWKIQFEWEIIVIDWIKFYSKPLDFKWDYRESDFEAEKVELRRLPGKKEFENLFELFTLNWEYNENSLKSLLSLSSNNCWSFTSPSAFAQFSFYGDFREGKTDGYSQIKDEIFSQVLCIDGEYPKIEDQ